MKAEATMITINGVSTLQVLLVPENVKEKEFLEEAKKKCIGYRVSCSAQEILQVNWPEILQVNWP